MNPPLMGVLSGLAVGLSPLGVLLFRAGTPSAAALLQDLPPELQLCTGAATRIAILYTNAWLLSQRIAHCLACKQLHNIGCSSAGPMAPPLLS